MLKLVTLSENDIVTDPEGAAHALSLALKRAGGMRFVSFCPIGRDFIGVFESAAESDSDDENDIESEAFVFSPMRDSSFDGVVAELNSRYDSGYSTLAAFFIHDTLWGLFRR